jgi:hypothetical protein
VRSAPATIEEVAFGNDRHPCCLINRRPRLERHADGEPPMTTDELAGQLTAVEVIAMTALGLYLANSRNDADYQKAAGLIEQMRQSIAQRSADMPLTGRTHAVGYGNTLLDTVSENLPALRGEGGQLN